MIRCYLKGLDLVLGRNHILRVGNISRAFSKIGNRQSNSDTKHDASSENPKFASKIRFDPLKKLDGSAVKVKDNKTSSSATLLSQTGSKAAASPTLTKKPSEMRTFKFKDAAAPVQATPSEPQPQSRVAAETNAYTKPSETPRAPPHLSLPKVVKAFVRDYLTTQQAFQRQPVVDKFLLNPSTQEYLNQPELENNFFRTLEILSLSLKVGFWEHRGVGRVHAQEARKILSLVYAHIAHHGFLDELEKQLDVIVERESLDTYYLKQVNQFIIRYWKHFIDDYSPIPSRLQETSDLVIFGQAVNRLYGLYFEFSPYLKDTWDENFFLKMIKAHELAENLLRAKLPRDSPVISQLKYLGLRFWKTYDAKQMAEFLKNRNDTNYVYLLYIYSKHSIDRATTGRLFIDEYHKRRNTITPSIFYQMMYSFGRIGLFDALMISDSKDLLKKPFCQIFIFLLSNNSLTSQEVNLHMKSMTDILRDLSDTKLAQNCFKATILLFAGELIKCAIRLDLTSQPIFLKIIHTCMVDDYPEKSAINLVIANHLNPDKVRMQYYNTSNLEHNALSTSAAPLTRSTESPPSNGGGYLVKQIERYLTKGGFRVYKEYDLGYHHVDLFVPDLKLFIEVDGETHTRQGGQTGVTEHTIFRNRLISKFSPFGEGYSLLVLDTDYAIDKSNKAITEVVAHINKHKPTL